MSFNQYLPTYKHLFETDKRFEIVETEHYQFHFFSDSEAANDINNIVKTQEKAYQKIVDFLQVEPPDKKINYFFYPTKKIKTELMGDDWYAQSILAEFRVHALYTDEIKPLGPHEDTHLLSLPWGLSFGFIQEGLAEFMVGHAWDGTSHSNYVVKGYQQKLFPPLESFFRHEAWLETDDNYALYFYSLAGSFSTYLIEKFGKENYKNFYKFSNHMKDQNVDLFIEIYKKTISKAEVDFINWLSEKS